MTARRLALLGSTGSIGVQTLEVVDRAPQPFRVVLLAAGRSLERLCDQARRYRPERVALEESSDPNAARAALERAATGARVWIGPGAAARALADAGAEVVVNAIVGAQGLAPSLVALERGARLALANKETLVVGGPLVRRALAAGSGELLPVDSEHSAALQCLGGRPESEVARLTLTASGGALRDHPRWREATRAEVLAHPVWAMGRRITVDSALLFNKGLELIEARWLFDLDWDRLEAVLHPEALIHAMVTFRDGASVVQAARPDMAIPIRLALSWPERWRDDGAPLGMADLGGLTFRPIPPGRYPAFELAVAAGREGGTAPCALNAADEVAVQAFLDDAIGLGQIPEILARVMEAHRSSPVESLEQLLEVDARARAAAREEVVRA